MKNIVVCIVLISFFGHYSVAQKSLSGVYTESNDGYLKANNHLGVIYE